MKKQILFLAFVIIGSISYAQSSMHGVRVGLNYSNLNYETDLSYDAADRYGFAIGFFGEYMLSKTVSLAPEIQFSAEGRKHRTMRIDYIQAPILAKFKLGNRFSIGAGPMAGLKIHEYEDGLKNIAFSGVGALEYLISDEFFIDARYHHGFTNVFDDDSSLGDDATNRSIQIGFGVKF
ncbi:porin family protein [Bizionia paragorgiae]|uniref:Outer membrane protein beta-barrel domain-containing protein n=1 Tax=Bizionia paragorgiae TaxID=283786 RepID=A0A1H4CQ39_BIZPA|nr:porin family protein [Bizionia paragorgiae]SEA62463.1 Outer membrane protein beta-barrel domain-containing protein [Bizionia paragorgiae]